MKTNATSIWLSVADQTRHQQSIAPQHHKHIYIYARTRKTNSLGKLYTKKIYIYIYKKRGRESDPSIHQICNQLLLLLSLLLGSTKLAIICTLLNILENISALLCSLIEQFSEKLVDVSGCWLVMMVLAFVGCMYSHIHIYAFQLKFKQHSPSPTKSWLCS